MADLIFHSLSLENFKGYSGLHKLRLDADPGLYHVVGQNMKARDLGSNGAGKSTIFDALLWVLFGKTGRDSKPGTAVVPWKGDNHVVVDLKLARGPNVFRITRCRNPNTLLYTKGNTAKVIEQEEVWKLIGMTEEMFRRTILLSQNAVLFLDLKAEAQAQMFTEALNLNIWLEASARAANEAKHLGWDVSELSGKKTVLDNIMTRIDADIVDAEKRADKTADELVEKHEAILEELAGVNKEVKAKEKKLGPQPGLANQFNARIAEILEELNGEDEHLVKAKYDLGKKIKPRKCSACGQPVVNKDLQRKIDDLEADSKALVKSLRDEMTALQQKRAAKDKVLQKELDEWRVKEREVLKLQAQANQLKHSSRLLETAVNPAAEEVGKLRKAKKENLSDLADIDGRLRAGEIKLTIAEFWVKTFKEIRLAIIDEVLLELELTAARHAEQLGLKGWEIKFETERETSAGAISYKFTVLLFPPGQEKAVKWENYSGGESQRWQLAVSFALSEVLLARAGVTTNVEILDEPTRGLSPVGIDDLLEHLRDRALETGRAIFFVDHHSLDRGAFDGVLQVTRDKQGSSFQWQ